MAAIPLLYLASVLSFWQLLVLVFVLSCLNMLGDSARYALIPGLAARARMPIERARPTGRSPPRLAQVVGPLLAGVLIALLGTWLGCWRRLGDRDRGDGSRSSQWPCSRLPQPALTNQKGMYLSCWQETNAASSPISACAGNATSLTPPPAQTAYCSGAATNRWWHPSEQK
jgi:hypothetical protein